MCGIVCFISSVVRLDLLLSSLYRLEYRGYDSCGMALINDKNLVVLKNLGKVINIKPNLNQLDLSCIKPIGIAQNNFFKNSFIR